MRSSNALITSFVVALAALLIVACSDDDDKGSDGGAGGDGGVTDGILDTGPTGDVAAPDMDLSKAPKIEKIIPADGFANGGSMGQTKVVMTGENFAQGAIVFIDGANQIMQVAVASPVSLSFNMPKNPYGAPDYNTPQKVSVAVFVDGMMSNSVDFQYTVSQAMDETFKGSVLTTSMDSFSDFESDPIDGKVFLEGVTDTTAGEAATLTAMIGIGPEGNDPSQDPGWRWFEMVRRQVQAG
jgi:hypothetical protein